ncbi:unnamed protein product, partial [Hymenolepis diminuta]
YCKANNVNIIAFPKNLNTLKSLPNNENFSELDPSYPLVIRRFTRGSPPQGFYLSRENDVLYAAKAGQVDTRSLINQVPPCRDWQRKSSRCFQRRQEIYPQLLAETASHISHFFSLLPGFDSVLRRSSVPEDLIKIEEQQ